MTDSEDPIKVRDTIKEVAKLASNEELFNFLWEMASLNLNDPLLDDVEAVNRYLLFNEVARRLTEKEFSAVDLNLDGIQPLALLPPDVENN